MTQEYKATIKQLVFNEEAFLRLTLKGAVRGKDIAWRRIVVRPVLLKQHRHLQFSYFDAKQDITKNYRGREAEEKLDEILNLPFSSLSIQTTTEDVHVQVTKDGKAIFSRSRPSITIEKPNLSHDLKKDLPLPADKPDAFLQTIGIMNAQGKVLASMQDKFTQINEFLKLLEHTGELEHIHTRPIHILDCGCGSAYLSLATYHYLNDIKGIPTQLTGVDTNGKLIEKSNLHSRELSFEHACFEQTAIIQYIPPVPPDIILALHACDTATDEALVQGILSNSQLIMCVPCCHHELHAQIHMVEAFRPILHHGILKKRMADILTDALRAQVLHLMGYKTDVVEFVSSEHTDRNLMIRAVKRGKVGDKKVMEEYRELKDFWGVTPYIEKLLREKGDWIE